MTPGELKVLLVAEVSAVVSAPVRMSGHNSLIEVPGVELSVNTAEPLPTEGGAQSYAGETVDVGGVATGEEHHFYHSMSFDARVRSRDETERDAMLDAITDRLSPYHDAPKSLHADVHRFQLGRRSESPLMFTEPEWHEGARLFTIQFVERQTIAGEPLESVTEQRRSSVDAEHTYFL